MKGGKDMKTTNKLLMIIILLLTWAQIKTFVIPEAVANSVQAVKIIAVGNTSTYGG